MSQELNLAGLFGRMLKVELLALCYDNGRRQTVAVGMKTGTIEAHRLGPVRCFWGVNIGESIAVKSVPI